MGRCQDNFIERACLPQSLSDPTSSCCPSLVTPLCSAFGVPAAPAPWPRCPDVRHSPASPLQPPFWVSPFLPLTVESRSRAVPCSTLLSAAAYSYSMHISPPPSSATSIYSFLTPLLRVEECISTKEACHQSHLKMCVCVFHCIYVEYPCLR